MVDLQRHLHAALLASSLNIGPTRMAEGDCTSVRRHVTAPSRRRAPRSTDRLHEQGEPSGAAPIGVDTSASAGLRHKRGRPAHGPRPAFVLRRNSTTARQETRFSRVAGNRRRRADQRWSRAVTRRAPGGEHVSHRVRAGHLHGCPRGPRAETPEFPRSRDPGGCCAWRGLSGYPWNRVSVTADKETDVGASHDLSFEFWWDHDGVPAGEDLGFASDVY